MILIPSVHGVDVITVLSTLLICRQFLACLSRRSVWPEFSTSLTELQLGELQPLSWMLFASISYRPDRPSSSAPALSLSFSARISIVCATKCVTAESDCGRPNRADDRYRNVRSNSSQ